MVKTSKENTEDACGNIAMIRSGICGPVRKPGIYDIPSGADLAMLIRKAGGLKPDADINNIIYEKAMMNDSIYHLAAYSNGCNSVFNIFDYINKSNGKSYSASTKALSDSLPGNDIRQVNLLYIGFPAVYLLISYFPDLERVSITHIPHSTVFLHNDYRLIDLLLTIGPEPTMKIVENKLSQKIDYFLIQDRFSFIRMIDLLQGIDAPIDKPFAEAYEITPGKCHLDGFYTWEFIRFLDMKRMKVTAKSNLKTDVIRNDNFIIQAEELQLAYELRQHRQKIVMTALRKSFKELSLSKIANQQINVFGFVNKPGQYQIYEGVTIFQAIGMAGGIKNFKKAKEIHIIRQNLSVEIVKLQQYMGGIHGDTPIPLVYAGDTIYIREPSEFNWSKGAFIVNALTLAVTLARLFI